jgi:hypothetical protein
MLANESLNKVAPLAVGSPEGFSLDDTAFGRVGTLGGGILFAEVVDCNSSTKSGSASIGFNSGAAASTSLTGSVRMDVLQPTVETVSNVLKSVREILLVFLAILILPKSNLVESRNIQTTSCCTIVRSWELSEPEV